MYPYSQAAKNVKLRLFPRGCKFFNTISAIWLLVLNNPGSQHVNNNFRKHASWIRIVVLNNLCQCTLTGEDIRWHLSSHNLHAHTHTHFLFFATISQFNLFMKSPFDWTLGATRDKFISTLNLNRCNLEAIISNLQLRTHSFDFRTNKF